MDFKSHEEFVLPSEEAKKKRARQAVGERRPAPQTRESPPDGRKQVTAPSSVGSAREEEPVPLPQLSVGEIRRSADQSSVDGAAASLIAGERIKSTDTQPKVLNAGARLLSRIPTRARSRSPVKEVDLPGENDTATGARREAANEMQPFESRHGEEVSTSTAEPLPMNEGPAPADVKDRTDSIAALCDRVDTLIEVVTASHQEIGGLQNQIEVLRGQIRGTEDSLEGVNSLVQQIALTLVGLVEREANPDPGESQESPTVD